MVVVVVGAIVVVDVVVVVGSGVVVVVVLLVVVVVVVVVVVTPLKVVSMVLETGVNTSTKGLMGRGKMLGVGELSRRVFVATDAVITGALVVIPNI